MLLSVFVFYSLLCLSPNVWEIEPTLDNRWGDFALPTTTSIGVERWVFRHMVDASGHAGLKWSNPEWDDSDWPMVHATFGPHGLWTGPDEPERLPAPLSTVDEWRTSQSVAVEWREAIYSLSRGIYKDRLHRATLGPKGHVPEEFLDFGFVRAGAAVQFRTTIALAAPLTVYFALPPSKLIRHSHINCWATIRRYRPCACGASESRSPKGIGGCCSLRLF